MRRGDLVMTFRVQMMYLTVQIELTMVIFCLFVIPFIFSLHLISFLQYNIYIKQIYDHPFF